MIRKFAGHDTETPPGTVTLNDYVKRVEEEEGWKPAEFMQGKPKLTFEQWYVDIEINTYDKTEYECMKMAWNASQENV